MADLTTEQLFELPKDMKEDLEKGLAKLPVLKRLAADLREVGYPQLEMEADLKRIEEQSKIIKRYVKPSLRNVTPKK